MGGSAEDGYASGSNEAKAGGSWGVAPPIMHSWCLQPDQPGSASECPWNDIRDSGSRLGNDADDDCGFDLNLGLSLGGGGGGGGSKSSKLKSKEKEREVLLDRDAFREKEGSQEHGQRRDDGVAKEASHGCGMMFKVLKTDQDGASQAFWQDADRSGSDAKEKGVGGGFAGRQGPSGAQAGEANWRGGESSVAEDSKMFEQYMWQVLQGTSGQGEHQRGDGSPQDEPRLMKELQGLTPQAVATAAVWARMVAQGGFPMQQLLEAMKDGVDPATREGGFQRSLSMKSYSSAPQSEVVGAPSPTMSQQTAGANGDLERSDSDVSKNMHMDQQQRHVAMIQQQELAEQLRKKELQTQKRQEARRKRKALLEEAKSRKTKKEEERAGTGTGGSNGKCGVEGPPGGLRRTSSLQPSCAMSKENSVSSPAESQDASQHGGEGGGLTAFRRPGSSSWMHHNWEGSPGMGGAGAAKAKVESMHGVGGGDGRTESGEQASESRRGVEKARDRGAKESSSGSGMHMEAVNENRKGGCGSPGVVPMEKMDVDASGEGRHAGSASRQEMDPAARAMGNGQMDPGWIQRTMGVQMSGYQLAAMMESKRENAAKMMSSFGGMARRGDGGADRAGGGAGAGASGSGEAERSAKKSRGSNQTSSGGTESSDGKDEKTNNGARMEQGDAEALSSPAGANGAVESRSNPANGVMGPDRSAMAMMSMPFPAGGGFPMMPGPFPFPMPVASGGGAGGVPFSMPFPFPYVMQFGAVPANPGDGNQEQRAHGVMASPFQVALPPGYPAFQIQTAEGGAGWAGAVVRPHVSPPESPPRSGAGKSGQAGSVREDERRGGRGAGKGNEHGRSRNASPGGECDPQGLVKASSMGSGAFNRLRTSAGASSSPLGPQSAMSRSKSDAVGLRREGMVGSAFASLGAESHAGGSGGQGSGQGMQSGGSKGSSGVGTPGRGEGGGCRGAAGAGDEGGGCGAGSGSAEQAEGAAVESASAGDEDVKRPQSSGVWRQGSSASLEGVGGHEASSLRPGIAAGQQFGGTGSPPDLPWVTCNGTISGVLYRVEKGQVRI
uniref:Uncharacterized protein n=3 Tax=Physcomitrium patens TaxID=3218 RepID=A0A7I4FAZ7_PHYPA